MGVSEGRGLLKILKYLLAAADIHSKNEGLWALTKPIKHIMETHILILFLAYSNFKFLCISNRFYSEKQFIKEVFQI